MNITEILKQSIENNASDVHLSPGLVPRMRVDGELVCMSGMPIQDAEMIFKHIRQLLNDDELKDLSDVNELDFSYYLPHLFRFRVNIFQQLTGLSAVIRLVPDMIPTLKQLEMPTIVKKILAVDSGLIIVSGATGSGKSSTLAAMINEINIQESLHIITIEDPIEFVHRSQKSIISQREVQRHTRSFATALRAAMREDPDIILIGEMRDLETIRLALTAAETGHLVLTTLHSSSAPRVVNRMIDVFADGEKNMVRNMLSESLQAVICQQLVKKTTGGRVAAYEIMLCTAAIRNMIRTDKISAMYSAMQTGHGVGMCTMEQYLNELVDKKMINQDQIVKTQHQFC